MSTAKGKSRKGLTRTGERVQFYAPSEVVDCIRVEAANRRECVNDVTARRMAESYGLDFDALVARGA